MMAQHASPRPHDQGHHKEELNEEKAQALGPGPWALGPGRFGCFEPGGYLLDTCMDVSSCLRLVS